MLKLITKDSVTEYKINLDTPTNFGELLKDVISSLHSYIYAIQEVEIDTGIKIIKLSEEPSYEKEIDEEFKKSIKEIIAYGRERDEAGKVIDSTLITKYVSFQREISDREMAFRMQEEYNYDRFMTYTRPRNRRRSVYSQSGSDPPSATDSSNESIVNDDDDDIVNEDADGDSSNDDDIPGLEEVEEVEEVEENVLPPPIPSSLMNFNIQNTQSTERRQQLFNFLNSILTSDVLSNVNQENMNVYDIGGGDEADDNDGTYSSENINNLINSSNFRNEIRNNILSGLLGGSDSSQPPSLNIITNLFNSINQAATNANSAEGQVTGTFQDTVKVVLGEEEFKKLPKKKYSEVKDDPTYPFTPKCSLTLEEFKDDDVVIILPCNHFFSTDVEGWLKEHSHKCIICRKEAGKGKPVL